MKLRAKLTRHGEAIDLRPSGIKVSESVRDIGFEELCFVGQRIEIDTVEDQVSLCPEEKYGQACIISWPDRLQRIIMGINKLGELQKGLSPPNTVPMDPEVARWVLARGA